MIKYGVTGSTGALGSLVIDHLVKLGVPVEDIVAIARDKSKTASLAARGVDLRIADYGQPETLNKAFSGIDRLLLVSGSEIGKRVEQHRNVINAAVHSSVNLLVYTSIFQAETSISPLADEHRATEDAIRKSGIPFVILRNNWYTENYLQDIHQAGTSGILEAAVGDGKVSSASRKDYAEAAARVLIDDSHRNEVYELAGKPWDYQELAAAASELTGQKIKYHAVSGEDRLISLKNAGLPPDIAGFVVALDQSIEAGALSGTSSDLESLLGHKPEDLKEGLRSALSR